MSLLQSLLALDHWLLRLVNVEWAVPAFDQFWLHLTQLHKVPWFAFGIFPVLLIYGASLYKWEIFKVLLAVAAAVAISDALAYRLIKSHVGRPRPFQNLEWVRKVGEAHGSSFPSNHATNVFAGAVVLAWYFRRAKYLLYTFATLVAVSRPVLGVHYPSDVLAGAILGGTVGFLFTILVLRRTRFLWLSPNVPS